LVSSKDNVKSFKLFNVSKMYESIIISIDCRKHLLSKITLFPKETAVPKIKGKATPRAEINYTAINLNPVFEKDLFNVKKYVKKEGNKYIAIGRYSKYRLFYKKIEKK
jgi:hypothetical protein